MWPRRITIFPEYTLVCAMSRYSIIAETFDFKQRSILNGTREIRNGVTPGSARIEKCVYRYVRSTRVGLYNSQPCLAVGLSSWFQCGLISLFARRRERERMRGVAAHGVFRPLDPCAWCNTDHTSIHCKWTSILVINTSRLSLGPSLQRPRHCLATLPSAAAPPPPPPPLLHPDRLHDHRNARDFSSGFACKWYACWRIRLTALPAHS